MEFDDPSIRGSEVLVGVQPLDQNAPALSSPFLGAQTVHTNLDAKAVPILPKQRSFTDSSGGAYSMPTTVTSGSPQSVISTISSDSDTPRRFKHYQKPNAATNPAIIRATEDALESGDLPALASIARTRGLPPHLRKAAWPLLLRSHPYVMNPQVRAEFPTTSVLIAETVPTKRIDGEVRRLRQRMERRPLEHLSGSSTPGTRAPSCASSVDSTGTDDEFYDRIGDAVRVFLERYGDSVRYDPAMVAVAYSLAQAAGGEPLDPEMFVNAMLIFNHASSTAVGPSGPEDSPTSGLMFRFIAALREQLPAVANHFDSEDVLRCFGGDQWLVMWLKWFGAKAFWHSDLARLWDIYFAWRPDASDSLFPNNPTPHETHLITCLAIMKSLHSKIMELDQSELRQLFSKVPQSKDIESVISEAVVMATKLGTL